MLTSAMQLLHLTYPKLQPFFILRNNMQRYLFSIFFTFENKEHAVYVCHLPGEDVPMN